MKYVALDKINRNNLYKPPLLCITRYLGPGKSGALKTAHWDYGNFNGAGINYDNAELTPHEQELANTTLSDGRLDRQKYVFEILFSVFSTGQGW